MTDGELAEGAWTPRLPSLRRVACLLFASGLCSLVYQVVWLRSLRLVFGSSTPATAVVLAIFMGGLGLGGAYFGRRVQRSRNPLALYANLELGIAVSAAVSLALVWVARESYLAIGGSAVLGGAGATLLRILLSVAVLGAPTFLMGGTLPVMAQAIERRTDVGRRIVATLYGVNTLGAVAGALVTTFWTLELLGVSRSLWLACAVNLLLALIARSWARQAEGLESFAGTDADAAADSSADAGLDSGAGAGLDAASSPSRLPLGALLGFAGLAGFLFFLMELVWYRMLTPLLGGSSYTFGLILALALLGIGAGGYLFSLGSRAERPAAQQLALSAALEALALALPFALGDRLAFLAQVARDFQGVGFVGIVAAWTLVASIVVLPASLVAGYQFPLLVALIGSGRDGVGTDVGRAYAWNTWGAVLGSLCGGLLLLSWLGALLLWRLSVVVLALSAVVLVLLENGLRPARLARLAAAALLTACLVLPLTLAEGPSAYWRHSAIATSRSPAPPDPAALQAARRSANQGLLAEADGRESTVALMARDGLSLLVNGKSDGSARGDAPTQVMGGLLGSALHPEPRRSLVIGLGTGMTAGWLARVETMERVDVVELEPAVVELSRYFRAGNLDLLGQPNVEIHVGDGREFVRTTDERYDIVFSEPSNPYRAGVADLFSREFYEAASARLAENGIFLQWLQLYEVNPEAVATVYATLGATFPFVETWQTLSGDLVLMCSNQPIRHDFARVRARLAGPPYDRALADVLRVAGIEGFYSGYVGNGRLAAALVGAAPINSDDRPRLEFSFARSLGRGSLIDALDLHRLAAKVGAQVPVGFGPAPDGLEVAEMRRVRQVVGSLPAGLSPPPDADGRARDEARLAYSKGEVADAWSHWSTQSQPPLTTYDLLLVADGMLQAYDPRAEDAVAALARQRPGEAALLDVLAQAEQGVPEAQLVDPWRRSLKVVSTDPWVHVELLERAMKRLEQTTDPDLALALYEVLASPLPGHVLDQDRAVLRLRLTSATGRFEELCREALRELEPDVLWMRPILELRLACYEATGDPLVGRARRDLRRFAAQETRSLEELAGT